MVTIGHNTESGRMLAGYIERVENIRVQKKQLTDDEALILADAKSNGFIPKLIRHVVKIRAMKPHDRQEAETVTDTYLHAIGMISETPLFRQVGLMSVDKASRDQVIEALKSFCPENGSITIEAGGRPVRLTRDKTGEVTASEVMETPAVATPAPPPAASGIAQRPEPPDVDPAGAEQLGREAFAENKPIVTNPFPYGDVRRARWDGGWRAASGSDGMGPGEP